MIEAFSGFLSAVRQTSPVIFLGLAIATGIILLVGDDTASTLGLKDLRAEHRGYIGGLFVISVSVVGAQAIHFVGQFVQSIIKDQLKRRKERQALEQQQKQLHELTPDEKACLAPYILEEKNTQYFQAEDGVAGGLGKKGIIYQPTIIGNLIEGFAFNLQPWARDYLQQNPHLLEGASEEPPRRRRL